MEQAEQIYLEIIAHPGHPQQAESLYQLGLIAEQRSRIDDAIRFFQKAIKERPAFTPPYTNLGIALSRQGKCDEAIAVFQQVVSLQPNDAGAHNNLGIALRESGRPRDAIAAHRRAILLDETSAAAHNNLGNALKEDGQLDNAIAAFERAIVLKPDFAKAMSNLGNALRERGKFDEAVIAHRRAVAISPDVGEIQANLGLALNCVGKFDEAIAACRRAISITPNLHQARASLANALLITGDYARGWEEYEWRFSLSDFKSIRRTFSQPQWNGCLVEGRTILLHAEQGFGDTIQFTRFLPLVAQRGAKIILECPRELQSLLSTVGKDITIVPAGSPLPDFDLQCSLMSLPRALGVTLANLPNQVPYLRPAASKVEKWKAMFSDQSDALKVGLAWAGSAEHKNDSDRSIPLASLAPLTRVSGVHFFSLQKPADPWESESVLRLVDATDKLKDFSDTTAMIAHLDLVIAVDTAVVHLAGAMGKPVWNLLPFIPDWRWMMDRQDSPWYPSMRLFRQPSRGDWSSVIKNVADALAVAVTR